MKVLVTGVNGMLGRDVVTEVMKRGHECIGSDITMVYSRQLYQPIIKNAIMQYVSMDITDFKTVIETIKKINPDVVIHCAAYTDVDEAEKIKNLNIVTKVNAFGTGYIASACKYIGAKMVFISTDYVFNGDGETPLIPNQVSDNALNIYGLSKKLGEEWVKYHLDKYFIIRTSWLFGMNGNNFIKSILNLSKLSSRNEFRSGVVCDQIGRPTYTEDLARLIVDMIETDKYGYYHATNEGHYISRYGLARAILKQIKEFDHDKCYDSEMELYPVTTEEYNNEIQNKNNCIIAPRPLNSRLDTSKLEENVFTPLPDWDDALCRYLNKLVANDHLNQEIDKLKNEGDISDD